MKGNWKVFIFDFDGVLVDSYSCLPLLYNHIAQYIKLENASYEFVKRALKFEDEQDAMGNYNRISWWPMLFRTFRVDMDEKKLDELLQIFHKERIEQTKIIEGVIDTLKWLSDREVVLTIVAGNDGQLSIKKRRIEKSGLIEFFKEIFIIGEDIVDRKEGIKLLMERYNASESQIIFFDDKPAPINEIQRNFKNITTVKVEIEGILKIAWRKEKCIPIYTIKAIDGIRRIVDV